MDVVEVGVARCDELLGTILDHEMPAVLVLDTQAGMNEGRKPRGSKRMVEIKLK